MALAHPITDAERRAQYSHSGLSRLISYEQATRSEAIRIALDGAAKAERRIAALRGRHAALAHQVIEQDAP